MASNNLQEKSRFALSLNVDRVTFQKASVVCAHAESQKRQMHRILPNDFALNTCSCVFAVFEIQIGFQQVHQIQENRLEYRDKSIQSNLSKLCVIFNKRNL